MTLQDFQARQTESPFPMYVFDLTSGALVSANEAAASAYGYTREELLVRTIGDISPLRDPEGGPVRLRGDEVTWTWSSRHRRKDGTTFEAEVGLIETGDAKLVAAVVVVHPTPNWVSYRSQE
jgi:PAS domain S-box-containing protein